MDVSCELGDGNSPIPGQIESGLTSAVPSLGAADAGEAEVEHPIGGVCWNVAVGGTRPALYEELEGHLRAEALVICRQGSNDALCSPHLDELKPGVVLEIVQWCGKEAVEAFAPVDQKPQLGDLL